VAVADPDLDLDDARAVLATVQAEPVFWDHGWGGPGLVGLVLSPSHRFSRRDLELCPDLRIVVTTSTGHDNIDVDACRENGVPVWHPTDYCSTEVADSAVAHLVGLLRGVTVLDRTVARGQWHFADAGLLRRFDATRLGILGFGAIGQKVAARARALGMQVRAHDPLVCSSVFADACVTGCELEELFETSTAVSIHVPLVEGTRGLVSAHLLGLLPPGAVLVNLSRGEVVDSDAVVAALESGRLMAASLDVLPVEPPTVEAPAPTHPRLVVTPHAAWYSEESAHILFRRPVEVVRDVLAGIVPDDALT
jgi:D-3-phosphoglycerate dehydrogenase